MDKEERATSQGQSSTGSSSSSSPQQPDLSGKNISCQSKLTLEDVKPCSSNSQVPVTTSSELQASSSELQVLSMDAEKIKNKAPSTCENTSAIVSSAQDLEMVDAMLLLASSSVHNEKSASAREIDRSLADLHTTGLCARDDRTAEHDSVDSTKSSKIRSSTAEDQEKKARVLDILSGSSISPHYLDMNKTIRKPKSGRFDKEQDGDTEQLQCPEAKNVLDEAIGDKLLSDTPGSLNSKQKNNANSLDGTGPAVVSMCSKTNVPVVSARSSLSGCKSSPFQGSLLSNQGTKSCQCDTKESCVCEDHESSGEVKSPFCSLKGDFPLSKCPSSNDSKCLKGSQVCHLNTEASHSTQSHTPDVKSHANLKDGAPSQSHRDAENPSPHTNKASCFLESSTPPPVDAPIVLPADSKTPFSSNSQTPPLTVESNIPPPSSDGKSTVLTDAPISLPSEAQVSADARNVQDSPSHKSINSFNTEARIRPEDPLRVIQGCVKSDSSSSQLKESNQPVKLSSKIPESEIPLVVRDSKPKKISPCFKTFTSPCETTPECLSSPADKSQSEISESPSKSPRFSPEDAGNSQNGSCEEDTVDDTPVESEAIDENFLANLAIKTNASFLLGLLPNRNDEKKEGEIDLRKKDEKEQKDKTKGENKPTSSSKSAHGSHSDDRDKSPKSSVKDATEPISSHRAPHDSSKSKNSSSTSAKSSSRSSSHSSRSSKEKNTTQSRIHTSKHSTSSHGSSSSRGSSKSARSSENKSREAKDSSSRKNDNELQTRKSSHKESGSDKKLDTERVASRKEGKSSDDTVVKAGERGTCPDRPKEVAPYSSKKRPTTEQSSLLPSLSSVGINKEDGKKRSVNSSQKVNEDSKCNRSKNDKEKNDVLDNSISGKTASSTDSESQLQLPDPTRGRRASKLSLISRSSSTRKEKNHSNSDESFSNSNKTGFGNDCEVQENSTNASRNISPNSTRHISTESSEASKKNSKLLPVEKANRAKKHKSNELPDERSDLKDPRNSSRESDDECVEIGFVTSNNSSKASSKCSKPVSSPQSIITPDPSSSFVITSVIGKANLTDDDSPVAPGYNSPDEHYESRIRSVTCSWCREVWSHYVLDSLFRSSCAVTVKSKITFGAIFLMYQWASKEKLPDQDEAILSLLERANLSKNLLGKNISMLVDWIELKLQREEQKCCDVFSLIYFSGASSCVATSTGDSESSSVQAKVLRDSDASCPDLPIDGNLSISKGKTQCSMKPLSKVTARKQLEVGELKMRNSSVKSTSRTKKSKPHAKTEQETKKPSDSETHNLYSEAHRNFNFPASPGRAIKEESTDLAKRGDVIYDENKDNILDDLNLEDFVKSLEFAPDDIFTVPSCLRNGPTNREHLRGQPVEKHIRSLYVESNSLSPDVKQIFFELPFRNPAEKRNSARFLSNREILSLHSLCIIQPSSPQTTLLYKALVQISKTRGRINLVPDPLLLAKLTEKLHIRYEKTTQDVEEFLDAPSLIDKLSIATSSLFAPKTVTVGVLLGIFCMWKNWSYIHSNGNSLEKVSLSSRPSLEKICKDYSINISCFDHLLHDCLKIHDKFCCYAFTTNDEEKAELYLTRPWSSQILASSLEKSFVERLQYSPSKPEPDSLLTQNPQKRTKNLENEMTFSVEDFPLSKKRKVQSEAEQLHHSALRTTVLKVHQRNQDHSALSHKWLKSGQLKERKQALPPIPQLKLELRMMKVLNMMLSAKQEKIVHAISGGRVGVKRSIESPTPQTAKRAKPASPCRQNDAAEQTDVKDPEISKPKRSDTIHETSSGDVQEKSIAVASSASRARKGTTEWRKSAEDLTGNTEPACRSTNVDSSTESSVCATLSDSCHGPCDPPDKISSTSETSSFNSRSEKSPAKEIQDSCTKVHERIKTPPVSQNKTKENELSPTVKATVRALLQSKKAEKSNVAHILLNCLKLLDLEGTGSPTHEMITQYAQSIDL